MRITTSTSIITTTTMRTTTTHEHHHHHHHDADEVFTSWGAETPKTFTRAAIDAHLSALDGGEYGKILRAKGILPGTDGTGSTSTTCPEEHEVRTGSCGLHRPAVRHRLGAPGGRLKELFGL
jgi:G3E family GTPase